MFERISGHRDGNETTCPGEALYAQLPALRERAAGNASPVSRVTAKPSTRRVRALRPVTLSGDVRFGDGSSPSGAALAIEFQAGGAAWQQIGTATCGADGRWTGQVALPQSGLVRAVYGGGSGRPRLESASTRVKVLPRVAIAMSAGRMRIGRRVTVRGTVQPVEATYVTLIVERRYRGRWATVERRRAAPARGRLPRPGAPAPHRPLPRLDQRRRDHPAPAPARGHAPRVRAPPLTWRRLSCAATGSRSTPRPPATSRARRRPTDCASRRRANGLQGDRGPDRDERAGHREAPVVEHHEGAAAVAAGADVLEHLVAADRPRVRGIAVLVVPRPDRERHRGGAQARTRRRLAHRPVAPALEQRADLARDLLADQHVEAVAAPRPGSSRAAGSPRRRGRSR